MPMNGIFSQRLAWCNQRAHALTAQLSLCRPSYLSTQAEPYKLPEEGYPEGTAALRAQSAFPMKSKVVQTAIHLWGETGVVGAVQGKMMETYYTDDA